MNLSENTQQSERDYAQLFAAAVALNPDKARRECAWLAPEQISTLPVRAFWTKITQGATLAQAADAAGKNFHAELLVWMARMPVYAQAQEYARVIEKKAYFVTISEQLAKVARAISSQDADLVQKQLDQLKALQTTGGAQREIKTVGAWAEEAIETMIKRRELGGIDFLKTGFSDFDERAPLDPHEATMVLLCGEPGAGKTILWAEFLFALAKQKPGIAFSLEMSGQRMLYRTLSGLTDISAMKMRQGYISPQDEKRLREEAEKLKKLRLFLATDRLAIHELHTQLYQMKRDEGIGWYGLDYLTLLGGHNDQEKWQRAESLGQDLLQINRDLGLCSIVIHTLNGKGEIAGGMGAKYDADVICTLVNDPEMGCAADMEAKKITFQKIRDSEAGLSSISLMKYKAKPHFVSTVTRTNDLGNQPKKNGFYKPAEREYIR